jgi:hypothetical protein
MISPGILRLIFGLFRLDLAIAEEPCGYVTAL